MNWLFKYIEFLCIIALLWPPSNAKIHHLSLVDDRRLSVELTNFAYLRGAYFNVEISNFTENAAYTQRQIGFMFTKGNEMEDYRKRNPRICPLISSYDDEYSILYFYFNFENKTLDVLRQGASVSNIRICSPVSVFSDDCLPEIPDNFGRRRDTRAVPNLQDKTVAVPPKTFADNSVKQSEAGSARSDSLPANKSADDGAMKSDDGDVKISTTKSETKKTDETSLKNKDSIIDNSNDDSNVDQIVRTPLQTRFPMTYENKEYYVKFSVQFRTTDEEGEYFFFFHNCYNFQQDYDQRLGVSFTISIVEKNLFSYLPGGEIVKPNLYFMLAFLFFVTALVWVYNLRRNRANVYKIHYLMSALVFIKSFSLFFHGVNFYFISMYGHQQEMWAVVFYIMHLLKGALLFGTIILIGTGWTFFKNFLTDRDRRLFMIIIPLQVLDNIALIIVSESEEGERNFKFWSQLFILIDLLCCAAIIMPVIWSIRHLQEASQTDGKAAFNLQKLKLFRHFYIIIIIYIYTTRILVYLISYVVPFRYEWLVDAVQEVGTWFFFAVSGYKFRPVSNNPYLRLSQSDDEGEVDVAMTQSGVLDGIVRIKKPGNDKNRRSQRRESESEQETALLTEQSLEHD